ncbi:bilin-binding protein-like isoform X2 [Nymphalis io]|uniref:bilin-binding protein-like isoform X2 n=1 Tax=Inachis io TaxID=171585 RepID=UPI002167DB97|nr:bilin-binding protein-like isoform X2 [Nymphalis io]
MYRFAFLAFVASVSAYVLLDSKCPEVTNVDNFNFESYSSGVWYEAARYYDDVVKDGKCGVLKYTQDGDVKKVKYTFVKNNKLMSIEGTVKLANDAGITGKLIHSLPYGANGTVVDSELNILAVDYDNFFICYYCQFDDAKKSYRESAWIFSRSQPLSKETETKINKFVKDSKFLNADKFVWPRFSEEDCRVEA